MKKFTNSLLMLALLAMTFSAFTGCKKGEEDPLLSLKSRNARITNFWTLNELKVNGATENLDGSTITLDINDNGTVISTTEGSFFGLQTSSSKTGAWEFTNDKEDVRFNYDNESSTLSILRLSSDDLWLREIDGSDVTEYRFENR